MSATILAFPSVTPLPRSGVDFSDMGAAQLMSRLADIVRDARNEQVPVPVGRARHLLEVLVRRLPELHQDLEELYEEINAAGRLTAEIIDRFLDAADTATDERRVYLANQRQFYRMAA